MRTSVNPGAQAPTRTLSRDDFLYPPLAPNRSGRLKLDRIHTMYWEECGNARGVPVVFLHGGPGGGSSPDHRRQFDPAFYRIILYDQRGAGQSTPLGELTDNTTQHLVADIEALRAHLGVSRWLVFGGSWGSTLALAYAETHAERALGLVLRGIFLGAPQEIDWFMHGIRFVFPEAWRSFAGFLPESERNDLLASYYRRHKLFLPDGALIGGVDGIRRIPSVIIQGRYDAVCPMLTADELHRAWPEAEYIVVPDAGHSAREPGIARELVAATDRFRARLR